MARIETWFNQDLKQAVKVQYLDGNVFSADNAGNVVGVNVFDDGEPATLGGSVSGSIIRADGVTVAAVGTLSGNQASIVLPQAAYVVPGVISIVIKLTSGTDITTLCAVVSNVYMSATDSVVDPGTIIQSIDTLIADINAAVASIPADYSSLWTSIAPAFSTSTAYTVGQYVTYNGNLYRFIVAHPAGTWNSAHVALVSIGNDIADLNGVLNDTNDNVFYSTQMTTDAVSSGWRLNESDGLCSANPGYKIDKYSVIAGTIVRIVSDDKFQFQTVASVPSTGQSNRVGRTYGVGTFDIIVPETAHYLIVSTPIDSNASAFLYIGSIKNEIKAVNDVSHACAFGNYSSDLSFYQQACSGDDGHVYANLTQIRSRMLFVGKDSSIRITPADGYLAHVRWYNANALNTFVSSQNIVSGLLTAPADYLIISLTTTSYGNITIEEGSNVTAIIYPISLQRNTAFIYSMSQSTDEATYVNVDLEAKKIIFGSSSTGVGRVYLRSESRVYQIGGQEFDFSSIFSTDSPFAFFFFNITDETFEVIGADSASLRQLDSNYIYFGSVWGTHPGVNLNVYPFYYVNGIKTYTSDKRGTFDANRSYGYDQYNIAVLGDSTSTYNGISENEIGGRTVRGAYYPTGNVDSSSKMWWAILQKMLRFGGAINVSAISRSRYLNDIDADGIYAPAVWNQERLARMHLNDNWAHYIFVNVGINDGFSTNVYGEFSYTNVESSIVAEPETIARGIELTLVRLIAQNPSARIVLMIPKLVAQNASGFNWKSYYKTCELIEQIGKAYGVFKIVDLRKCGITEGNSSIYTFDGIHPNAEGMKMIAAYVYNCITDDEQPIKLH